MATTPPAGPYQPYSAAEEAVHSFITLQRDAMADRLVRADTDEELRDLRAEARVLQRMQQQLHDLQHQQKKHIAKVMGKVNNPNG